MDKSKLKTVILDFDGTIADTINLLVSMYNESANKYGMVALTPEQVEELRYKPANEVIKALKMPRLKFWRLGIGIMRDMLPRMDKVAVFPQAVEMIAYFRQQGYDIAIISSNRKRNIVRFLQKEDYGITEVHGYSLFLSKGRLIKRFMRKRNLQAENVLYVGDEIRDIEAARIAGVEVMSVSWGYNKREALAAANPDYLVDSVEQIKEIV